MKQIAKRFCEGLSILLKYIQTQRMYEEIFLGGKNSLETLIQLNCFIKLVYFLISHGF